MKVIFNHPRIVDGVLYPKSKSHVELSEKQLDHWFVKALMKEGDISAVIEEKAVEEKAAESVKAKK